MLPISTKEIIRFVPEQCREMTDPPTYLLSVPSEWGKSELRRQMMSAAGARPTDEHFTRALLEGIREVMPVEHQAEHIEAVEKFSAFDPAEAPIGLSIQIAGIEERVASLYPPYAALLSARSRHDEYLPIMAARLFLKGVENVDVPFTLTAGRVSDDTLAALDPKHLVRVGLELVGMMYVQRDREKNLESPSRSPSAPATSEAGGKRRTGNSSGGSSAKFTKKTRASS